ncbi:UNVERIFIED_ORG: hypothetical protein E4P37_07570 [Bacillus sp. AZ43]
MPGVRSARSSVALAAALAVLAVPFLTGCGDNAPARAAAPSSSAAPSPEPVEPVVISTDPPLGSVEVAPVTPLHVTAGHGTLTAVTVIDPSGEVLPGGLDPSGTHWVATADLAYGTTYSVTASAVDTGGGRRDATGTISIVAPRTLTMPAVFPTEETGAVGVGQPVSITFDEDVTDRAAVERRLRVTSTPPVVGSWSWLSDRTVQYRPQQYWPSGAHVVVDADVYGVDVGGGIRGQASRHVEFDIGQKKVAVVDATERMLRLYVDDQLVRTMRTSLGKASTPTPTGTYVVMQQSRNYTMRSASYGVPADSPDGYETPVEYASRLSNSGIFVHAAPWSVGDQGRRNVSHGCLNVSTADAGWFYANFGRGDIVEVTNAGRRLDVGDGYGAWNVSWEEWVAGSALA